MSVRRAGVLERLHLPLLCVVFAAIIVVWGVILLWQQLNIRAKVQVPFRRIQVVSNAKHLAPASIAKMVQHNMHGDFFSLNAEKLRQALLTEPWIAQVSFRRIWPDTLQVDVIEQEPVAIWLNNQLINSRGQLFAAPQNSWPAQLPKFNGPDTAIVEMLDKYTLWQQDLAKLHLKITEINVSRNLSWSLILDNSLQVTLGEQLKDENFSRFITLYPKIIAPNKDQAISIDLRYPHGVAVKWRQTTTETDKS